MRLFASLALLLAAGVAAHAAPAPFPKPGPTQNPELVLVAPSPTIAEHARTYFDPKHGLFAADLALDDLVLGALGDVRDDWARIRWVEKRLRATVDKDGVVHVRMTGPAPVVRAVLFAAELRLASPPPTGAQRDEALARLAEFERRWVAMQRLRAIGPRGCVTDDDYWATHAAISRTKIELNPLRVRSRPRVSR